MIHRDSHTTSLSAPKGTLPSPLSPLLWLLLLLVVSGCGTGEYESRLNERIGRLQKEAKYNDLYVAQPLPEMPAVSVRMPQIFKDSPFLPETRVDKANQPLDPRRVKPELFELPWLKLTYESFAEDTSGVKTPYYCYLGAVDIAAGKIKNFERDLHAKLSQKQKDSLTGWTDIQTETPDGKTTRWKTLRFVGPQDFFIMDRASPGQFKSMPGVLEIYLHEEAGYYVLIAWRMPTTIERQMDLAKLAPLVAGCATVKK